MSTGSGDVGGLLRLPGRGLADSTLAMVFKVEGDEIVCIDAFHSVDEAFASLRSS